MEKKLLVALGWVDFCEEDCEPGYNHTHRTIVPRETPQCECGEKMEFYSELYQRNTGYPAKSDDGQYSSDEVTEAKFLCSKCDNTSSKLTLINPKLVVQKSLIT